MGFSFSDVLRGLILCAVVVLLFLSQRYWLKKLLELKSKVRHAGVRAALRASWAALVLFLVIAFLLWRTGLLPRGSWLGPLLGLWFATGLFAYVAVKLVYGAEWLWRHTRKRLRDSKVDVVALLAEPLRPSFQPAKIAAPLENPQRRFFFQNAARFAGAVPFVGALYGFAAERLNYEFETVEVPIANLPPALDGLRIAQLSDIHIGAYLPRQQVRRAVDMANDLDAELAVVTGDFITSANDPLEDCVAELARLRAPLGVWGCLGNHEIYAQCEDLATELLQRVGIRVLRRQNAELRWNGAALNLIGVDYQRSRGVNGRRLPMLAGVDPLVRRDVPNILLSHNPNAFERAPELGIELTLAGHTHGGQISVEILDRNFSPARFVTDWIAGLYQRAVSLTSAASHLYVNRGIGTVGAPVRLGAPPEITLLTLRRV